ncbi:uncharacterized protein LOC134928736 isoform X2 [Pseudophryne corroboree]|uniref:uncharacterized protein LOC134928736 isoform X2 n=1 Tax=Pseudophryne corroboree TaxID=495146 RepID=UPI0030819C4D
MEMPEKCQPLPGRNKVRPTITEEMLTSENIPSVEKVRAVTGEEGEEAGAEGEDSEEIPAILQKILATKSPPASDTDSVAHLSPPPPIHKTTSAPITQRPAVSRIPRQRLPKTKSSGQSTISVPPPSAEPHLPPLPNVSEKPTAPSPEMQKAEQHVDMPQVQETPPFILQFQERSWFSSILPDVQTGHSEFESCLLQGVLQADIPVRTQLLQALQTLHRQGHLTDPQKVLHTLREAIDTMTGEQAYEDSDFLWYLLRFMNDLLRGSSELVLELLVTCVLVEPFYREKYLALFEELGVQDPHGFIGKKCSSWDNWEQTEKSRKILRKTCEDWMRRWTHRLIEYVQTAVTQNIGPRTVMRQKESIAATGRDRDT